MKLGYILLEAVHMCTASTGILLSESYRGHYSSFATQGTKQDMHQALNESKEKKIAL